MSAVRTPVGKFGGALRDVTAVELGATAIRAALERAASGFVGADALASKVDYVLMGHVVQAGTGQNPARQAAVAAGIPSHVPALTLNKVCLASLAAIALADQLIRAGDIEIAVAGGMESMSQAPYLLRSNRWGQSLGDATVVDSLVHDGLWSTFTGQHMGASSDDVNVVLGISREDQDAWAARSHERAAAASQAGTFDAESTPVVINFDTNPAGLQRDEGIRPGTSIARARDAASGLHPVRHDYGGQCLAAVRRGGGARRHARRPSRGNRPRAARRDRGTRHVGNRLFYLHTVAGPRVAAGAQEGPVARSTMSACSRSTRPLPPSPCTPRACSARTKSG